MGYNVADLLSKMDAATGKNKNKGGGKIDYKEISEAKKRDFYKFKEGKNNLVLVTLEPGGEPFTFWNIHEGLQEKAFYSIDCKEKNDGEDCLVCSVVKELQDEDYKGNETTWKPIRWKTQYYATVVNVESEATIKEGIKWVKLANSITGTMTEWLRNLEADEEPFYSDKEPQKLIITYDSSAAPADKYKIDKKSYKGFSEEQLTEWRSKLKPFREYQILKSQAEVKKLVDSYLEKVANEVSESSDTESKLSSLKN